MISGTFHPMAQEWRYYSREKSLIHTLHVAELPTTITGQSIIISPTVPTGTTGGSNGFNVGPITLPDITPYNGLQINRSNFNIPPLWTTTTDSLATVNQSGSYGPWSGTFSDFVANKTVASYQWPSTGGTYLVEAVGIDSLAALNIMNPTEVQIFESTNPGLGNGTQAGDHSDVRQDAQWGYALIGTWLVTHYLSVGGAQSRSSQILQVPSKTSMGMYVQPTTSLNSFSSVYLLAMRLGP